MMRRCAPPAFISISIIAICAALFFAPAGPPCARAAPPRESPKPFETISIEIRFLAAAADETFERYWDPGPGALVGAAAPFYAGFVEMGVHLFENKKSDPEVPAFDAYYLYLGWGYEWTLPLDLRAGGALRAGGLYMDFDDPALPSEGRTESELAIGFDARLRYPLSSGWSILVGGDYRRILTQKPIDYYFFGAGAAYAFETPGSLAGFLE